jgi:hypothetical protein
MLGANMFSGLNEPKRQKFAATAAEATEVLVVGLPQAGAAVLLVGCGL